MVVGLAAGDWTDGAVSLRRTVYDVEQTIRAFSGLTLEPHVVRRLSEVLRTGVADELKLANLQPQIAARRHQLNGSGKIGVAAFGRFKAGKISPESSDRARGAAHWRGAAHGRHYATALGPAERAEVRFLNGTAQTIPLDDIGLYVAENENPDNAKQVPSVEVELPALKPLAPLEFVDTPGLGSAFNHNTEAALKWLPNVGAALVAVSCDATRRKLRSC